MPRLLVSAVLALLLAGGAYALLRGEAPPAAPPGPPADLHDPRWQRAVFAGGCFWCMETAFEGLPGVVAVTSGYAGGTLDRPTYAQVSSGGTGHAEVVEVVFDPARTSYAALLEVFWRNVDPTTPNRQFCDVGEQYRSAIFTIGEEQERMALASRKALEDEGRFARVVTEVAPLARFWPAEDEHQDYWRKNPLRYKTYRAGCGRDRRLEELWGAAPARH